MLPWSIQYKDHVFPLTTAEEILTAHDIIRGDIRAMPYAEIASRLDNLVLLMAADKNLENPARPIMSEEDLIHIDRLPYVELGAHTVSHSKLTSLTSEIKNFEIRQSKIVLESILGRRVGLFSYPYGDSSAFDKECIDICKSAGFDTALANVQDSVNENSDLFALPRLLVRDWNKEEFANWLRDNDKSSYERSAVASRNERLKKIAQPSKPSVQPSTKRNNNILHINTHPAGGGAARSTELLTTWQRKKGMNTSTLASENNEKVPFVHIFDSKRQRHLIAQCTEQGLQYYDFHGSHELTDRPEVLEADLVHFQNLHGDYFNPFSLIPLSYKKPTVWTLRDMQAITGHCAHSMECGKWEYGCGECPDLAVYPGIKVDNTKGIWRDKSYIYDNSLLNIVCPSFWLGDKVSKSVLKNQPLTVIYNGVDTEVFYPRNRDQVRQALGISEDTYVFGVVAHCGMSNTWKGGIYLKEAIPAIRSALGEKCLFISVGNNEINTPTMGNDGILYIPSIEKQVDMAGMYSAFDCFLYTTIADTAPLVVIESIACGVPVVSFATGGVPEIARHGYEGLIVPYKDTHALVQAAIELVRSPDKQSNFKRSCRERGERIFSITRAVEEYTALYEAVISKHALRKEKFAAINLNDIPEIVRVPALLSSLRSAGVPVRSGHV